MHRKDSTVILLCSVSQFDITSCIISPMIRFNLEVVYILHALSTHRSKMMCINKMIHVFGPVAGMWPGHVLCQNNIPVVRIIIFIGVVATERDFYSFGLRYLLDIQWVLRSLVDMGCSGTQKVVMWACDAGRLKSPSAHKGLNKKVYWKPLKLCVFSRAVVNSWAI